MILLCERCPIQSTQSKQKRVLSLLLKSDLLITNVPRHNILNNSLMNISGGVGGRCGFDFANVRTPCFHLSLAEPTHGRSFAAQSGAPLKTS